MSTEKFLFLYGSETGNSESICKNLHNEAVKTKGFADAQCMTMNSAISKKVLDEQTNEETAKPLCLVIVCSTTGEGEPPENAARFRRWLRNTKEKLFRVRHTLLALGDTNYNNFCSAGKYIDTKLSEFGSMRFFPRGEADDGVDLNLIVEPWTARVWDHIHNTTNAIGHEAFSATEQHYVDMSVAQEVAIVYANANHICASFALFMYERILELGGKANVYPVQYFNPTTVAVEAKIVLFIFSTDVDEHTLCEACAAASNLPPPLGTFSDVFLSPDVESGSLKRQPIPIVDWLSSPGLTSFASVCLAVQPERVPRATKLDQCIKAVMTLFDIQPLFKGLTKPTVEGGVSTIASTAPDLLTWCESILDNLPGVTATEERIKQSVGWFFEASVTSTFLSVHDDPSRNREKEKGKPSHHHHARVERGAKAVGTRDRDLVKDILTPLVILYSSGDSIIQSIAKDLGELAESNYLHCVVSELSNIRRVGFPRKATFLFVVSGEITKSSSKLLKSLPSISNDKKTFELVKFAILGIAQSSRNEKFNAFALELETLLLSLHANKIHCTALADVDLPGELNRVVESFKSNLWGAIMKPSTSAAYLDANSPNISCCHKFPSSSFSADSEQSPLLASSSGAAIGTVNLSGGVAVTWDSIPVFREAAAELPVAFLYSSSGMSRTIATIAVNMATASGFTKVVLKSFSKYYEVDTSVYANWILFCESTPDGLSNGGVRLRRFLQNPSRQPDDLSHIQFSVLGLGSVNPNVTHPAFGWAALLSNLQANRVFPVAVMQSMSQVHSIGVPWTECVLATMTMLSPCRATTKPKEPAVNPVEFPLVNAKHILFLYGSSNGVTESIARDLHLDAKRRGYVARIGPLRSYDKMNFLSTPTIVLLTSTINTNFGGLPKTCEGFANFIFDKDHIGSRNLLYGTRFAVLGTGNERLYPKFFCKAAVQLDRRLEEIGGARLLPVGKVNVAADFTDSVESWRERFFDSLDRVVTNEEHVSALVDNIHSASQRSSEVGSYVAPLLTKAMRDVKVYIVTSCHHNNAVPGIAEYLQGMIAENVESLMANICDINQLTKMNLRSQPHILIFIMGISDIDELTLEGSSFSRLLRQVTTPKDILHHVRYTVLSVLETNGSSFLAGRQMDNRLEEFGATRFYARGEAVDSYSLQKTVERWLNGLYAALSTQIEQLQSEAEVTVLSHVQSDLNMTSPPLAGDDSEQKTEHSSILTRYQAENALTGPAGGTNDAVICQWRNMTVSGNRVIQLTLSVSEETVWQPGQTIALLPWNETSVVDRFLKHFNENGEAPFHPLSVVGEASSCFVNSPIYSYIDFPLSLRKVLTRYVSLRIKNSNGKEIIGLLKQHTESADDHAALNAILQELTSTPTELITILEKFPHIKPPIRHLIENLFTLQPREYSICSAKSKYPHHLSICFKVVPFGLCTHWLFEQCLWSSNLPVPKEDAARSGEWQKVVRRCVIPFVLRPPTEFRMPKDPLIPLILIGPGLGVNPFIAFLEEREQQVKERGGLVTSAQESPLSEGNPTTGTIDLFFGCRRRYEDFLFKEELSSFFQTKVLNSLTVAFSREANDGAFWYGGCYVQEKLLESALVISELITQKSAYVYVCGDINMGKEVHQTLIEIIQQTTGKSESGATEYVEYIMSQGRYTRDVW